jgi:hypothetical protein
MWWFKKVSPGQHQHMSLPLTKAAPAFQTINNTNVYHEKWWYTSQLFDPDWTPRDTLEHAPPAEPFIANVA